jgi:hypothetical protein
LGQWRIKSLPSKSMFVDLEFVTHSSFARKVIGQLLILSLSLLDRK